MAPVATKRSKEKAVMPALRAVMKQHQGIVRRGEYEILGQVEEIWQNDQSLKFGSAGPVIARGKADGTLVFLTEFKGLPDITHVTEEHCPDCLADCDVCKKKGKVKCSLANGCRGTGIQRLLLGSCSCVKNNKAHKSCRKCKGAGALYEERKCPGCKGTKLERCNQCRGNKQYSTGKVDGNTDIRAKLCQTCNGLQRAVTAEVQPIEDFNSNEDPESVIIRNVTALAWRNMSMAQEAHDAYQICDIAEDSFGERMTVIVDKASNMYCIGGVPQLRA